MESAIQVLGVTKKFDTRTVLDAIRLDVYRGETLCILGGSGSGSISSSTKGSSFI